MLNILQIINDTLVSRFRQVPQFLYLAAHKLKSNTHSSQEHRRKKFQRLEIKIEITANYHNLNPNPNPSHTTVNF